MPRDNDKNNDSRGRRDRPSGGKGRSGAARGPEKKFAKRGFAGKSDGDKRDGERRPYAGKPDGAKSYGKKPYSGPASPMPASAREMRRDRVAIVRPAIGRSGSTAMIVPAVAARSAPIPRAAIAPTSTATTALRAPIAATPARPRVSRTRNSATSGLIRHERVAVRSGPTRRAATGPKAIVPTARARRAMATVPVATGPSENSAATRSFPAAARRIAARARISAAAPTAVPIVAIQNRGRSATPVRPIMPDAIRARPVTARAISTDRAAIVRRAIVRFASGRNSTVPAKAATNVRAVTGRRATVPVSIARARIVPARPSEIRSSARRRLLLAGTSAQRFPLRTAAPRQ